MQPVQNQKMLCAAEMLEGIDLPNGWKVVAKAAKSDTGGCFSVPYFVERQNGKTKQTAFLKALNFRRILNETDITRAMERHSKAFNFEKETLELCRNKNLTRIATLIDAGQYTPQNSLIPVAYIIFELAKGGDARKQLAAFKQFDLAWTLRTLHQVSVGLDQLHNGGIAHQDLKPSNILFYEAFGAKIADLGCADTADKPSQSPRGLEPCAGDPTYAPPELRYGDVSLDWKIRRLGCDHYLLGNLVMFFLTHGGSFNAFFQRKVHHQHHALNWPHDYRSVLPYLNNAFEETLEEIRTTLPTPIQDNIIEILRWLCHPDPKLRGHPKDISQVHGNQFNMQRIVSSFNRLATKAEHGILDH
jgi:eukaryotic-like serine/threonine-protein kinase